MDATAFIYVTIEAVVGVISAVGNMLVLVAIYRTRTLQTATNCFIGSLALADLIVGLTVAPLAALSFVGLPHNLMGCLFVNSLVVVFTQVSIFGLLAIAVERFIAIKYPFAYQKCVTICRSIFTLAVTWILAWIVGLVPMFGWNKAKNWKADSNCSFTVVIGYDYMVYFNFFGFVLTPLLIMFAIYIYIFSIVHSQMAAMSALNITDSTKKKRKFLREIKAAKSLVFIIVLFVVCWLPIHICNCISQFCTSCNIPIPVLLAAIILSHANSMVNPVLYAYGNSKFKTAFRKLCCCPVSWDDGESTDYATHKPTSANHSGQPSGPVNHDTDTTQVSNPVTNGEIEFSDFKQQPINGNIKQSGNVNISTTELISAHHFTNGSQQKRSGDVYVIETESDSLNETDKNFNNGLQKSIHKAKHSGNEETGVTESKPQQAVTESESFNISTQNAPDRGKEEISYSETGEKSGQYSEGRSEFDGTQDSNKDKQESDVYILESGDSSVPSPDSLSNNVILSTHL